MRTWSKTILTLTLVFPATSALSATSTMYFLEHYEKPSRCYYMTKSRLEKANGANISHMFGTLTYQDGLLTEVNETIDSESGDWVMFDTYRVNAKGLPIRLTRTLNTFFGDVTVEETFTFSNGRPHRTAVAVRDLKTQKPADIKTRGFIPAAIPVRRSLPYPTQMARAAKDSCEQTK
jgi:hypothetical protein